MLNELAFEDAVRVDKLRARYDNLNVLDEVSFRVRPGEICVVLGPSGCGKSTLLKHLIGLMPPASGLVELLGQNLAAADEPVREAVLSRTGMLFQSGALINAMSLVDNVALPLIERGHVSSELAHDIARFKLELVDLGHAAHLAPPALSGGMKKRAALARAMALDPEVLFCDEPSAGLDPVMAAELDQLLLNLRDQFGMAMVVVTHELASIRTIADQVVMLDGGRVIASGTLETVERLQLPSVRSFFDRAVGRRAKTRALGDLLSKGS